MTPAQTIVVLSEAVKTLNACLAEARAAGIKVEPSLTQDGKVSITIRRK